MKVNKIIGYFIYLVVFCLLAILVKYIFMSMKNEQLEMLDYIFGGGYGFMMWLFYLFSGRLNKS
ncbi:hypothetical protein TPENAI_30049 [Tenacibaculum litopenaei]